MELHDHVVRAVPALPAASARVSVARACAGLLMVAAALAAVLANMASGSPSSTEQLPVEADVVAPTLPIPAVVVMYENPDARWAPASELAATASVVPAPDVRPPSQGEPGIGAAAALVPAPPGANGGGAHG